jgi:uncharacterized cupin superfamily protein
MGRDPRPPADPRGGKAVVRRGVELLPGSRGVDYHFHHGTEEFLSSFAGRQRYGHRAVSANWQRVRSHTFRPGPAAHTVMNLSDAPMRYVMLAVHASPDIVEYPDKGEFAAGAKSLSQRGEQFFVRLPLPDE